MQKNKTNNKWTYKSTSLLKGRKMKKLVIAATIVFAAVASQAATVKWVTANNLTGVDTSGVGDNGVYSAGGSALKNNSTITFSLFIYEAGTDTLVDSVTDQTVKYATGKQTVSSTWKDNAVALGTTYDYRLIVTGTQADLQALGLSGDYDYSAAMISGETSGTFTTLASGTTTLTADIANWTVSGIAAADVPEPTSGLLVLLGVAGLALRRRA